MSVYRLLAFVRRHDAGPDGYGAIWGGIDRSDYPPKYLTQMTVREVLAWQDSIDHKYMSEAAGGYQFLEDTLRGLYREAGVPLDARFDAETQDKLAMQLLRRRGLDDYLEGEMSAEAFANSLAKEWASLPLVTGPKRGKSYYGGDGLNAANADPEEFLRVVRSVRDEPMVRPKPRPRKNPAESKTLRGVVGAVTSGAAGVVGAVSQLDGPVQLLVIGAAIAALVFLLVVARERLRKWAEGDR